jgi:hypothetical protein
VSDEACVYVEGEEGGGRRGGKGGEREGGREGGRGGEGGREREGRGREGGKEERRGGREGGGEGERGGYTGQSACRAGPPIHPFLPFSLFLCDSRRTADGRLVSMSSLDW